MYVYDSRSIQKDATFLCLPGGERYLADVLQQGVKTIFYLNRVQLAQLAHDVHGKPSNSLVVIGVTGTNGKTSVCHFLQQALVQLGQKPAVQGTLTHNLTTPESLDTQAFMAKHLSLGGTHFVMEVSSHGIAQNRIDCIDFDVTCLTNISQDHLDYHGTMDDYQRVKYSFMNHYPGQSIFPEDFLSLPDVKNNVVFGMFNQAN